MLPLGSRASLSGGWPANLYCPYGPPWRHGYDTAAFVSAFVLNSSWGLNRGFQTYDDHFGLQQNVLRNPENSERRADETVGQLLAWFQARARRGAASRPFFVWLHLYDP